MSLMTSCREQIWGIASLVDNIIEDVNPVLTELTVTVLVEFKYGTNEGPLCSYSVSTFMGTCIERIGDG